MAANPKHYVNNADFLQAIIEYRLKVKEAKETDKEKPRLSNYIGACFLKIAEHLSRKPNFISYSFREEMISDGIENCIQYVDNFDPDKSKNPFAYFTQIAWYAFLRRIAKEKKQQDIKLKYLSQSGIEEYIFSENGDTASTQVLQAFIDQLKDRIDKVKEKDTEFTKFSREEKVRRKYQITVDSDLQDFME